MPTYLIPSFLLFCYVGAITPGPANICSLSAALRYGRKAALVQWRGIFVGFACVSLASVVVTWLLGAALSQYVGYLSWIGAAYILWMAWHTLRSSGISADKDPARPSFRSGLFLQLTNVKIMICCLTAMTSYVLPYTNSFWSLLAVGLFMPFTGPIANLLWLFAGASLKKLFENHRRAVDIVMAAALALCAVSLVWPH
ncbi:MAG: LysE family transporter [Oscillospiraceae bacterium]|nr:LysE family transporter [Oscillospiraceae bacterium]